MPRSTRGLRNRKPADTVKTLGETPGDPASQEYFEDIMQRYTQNLDDSDHDDSIVVSDVEPANSIEGENPVSEIFTSPEYQPTEPEATEPEVTEPKATEPEISIDVAALSARERKAMLAALREAQAAERAERRQSRQSDQALTAEERAAKQAADQAVLEDIARHLLRQPITITSTSPGGFYRYTGAVTVVDTVYNVTATMKVAQKRGRRPKAKVENGEVTSAETSDEVVSPETSDEVVSQ